MLVAWGYTFRGSNDLYCVHQDCGGTIREDWTRVEHLPDCPTAKVEAALLRDTVKKP